MSAEKLKSDEVPEKFAQWLLSMGCPTEKVPSIEKIAQMCRGQYYMVWRSVIEHVDAKNIVRQKRLQVFCDDVKLCKENNAFNGHAANLVVPEQLTVWQEQQCFKEKVLDRESRVTQTQSKLSDLIDKISCKVNQRNSTSRSIEAIQRRLCLLQHLTNELTTKKRNLEETRTIANSLCHIETGEDIQNKLEKCLVLVTPNQIVSTPLTNPIASSSIVLTNENDGNSEKEEIIMSLSSYRGDALWPLIYEKRSTVVAEISHINAKDKLDTIDSSTTPPSVLARTAALHASIALQVVKNKIHVKQTLDRFAAAVEDFNNYMTGESCELLVLRCERAKLEARVKALKNLLEDITNKSGVFHVDDENFDSKCGTHKKIADIDKRIVNTRDELKRLIALLAVMERKITNVKDYLLAVFNALHNDTPMDGSRFCGVNIDFHQESISSLRQFYSERCERTKGKNLSLDLDVSDISLNDTTDPNPRFVDELKYYLKKFNLEKNRKLILDSGEKIWIFETLKSSMTKLNSQWIENDATPILCPSIHISTSIKQLMNKMQEKCDLTNLVKRFNQKEELSFNIDISTKIQQESIVVDNIKKLISENLILLQKTNKNLDLCEDNLQFWSNDEMKKYMSSNRTVDGKTYRHYEAFYLENIKLNS